MFYMWISLIGIFVMLLIFWGMISAFKVLRRGRGRQSQQTPGQQPRQQPQQASRESLWKKFWRFLTDNSLGKLVIIAIGVGAVNFLFYLALKSFDPNRNLYGEFYRNDAYLWWLLNLSVILLTFFALTKTKQGKYIDRLIWLAVLIGIAGFVIRIAETHISFGSQGRHIAHAKRMVPLPASGMQRKNAELVRASMPEYPVMWKVAACESNYRQFNDDHILQNPSSDALGIFQIRRSTWDDIGARDFNTPDKNKWGNVVAPKLGYDIRTLQGNINFARYLYEHYGLERWHASENCWSNVMLAQGNVRASRQDFGLLIGRSVGIHRPDLSLPVEETPLGVRVVRIKTLPGEAQPSQPDSDKKNPVMYYIPKNGPDTCSNLSGTGDFYIWIDRGNSQIEGPIEIKTTGTQEIGNFSGFAIASAVSEPVYVTIRLKSHRARTPCNWEN